MFSVIAPRYDLITQLFSYGMDRGWKRSAVEMAALRPSAIVLDLACGTGDFSKLVRARAGATLTVACDLTEAMLRLARADILVCGDALHLPFGDATFDAVFVGYGLRNFPSLENAVQEIARVTRAGGILISLDFFLPRNSFLRSLYLGWLYMQGAFWGALLHGSPRVYTYIPDSLRSFVSLDEFSGLLNAMGYEHVTSRAYLLGGIGLHRAQRAPQPEACATSHIQSR